MLNNFFINSIIFWENCNKLFWGAYLTFFMERGLLSQKIDIVFFYHELQNTVKDILL